MNIYPQGFLNGTLPAPGTGQGFNGMVHSVEFSVDPAKNTGYISIQKFVNGTPVTVRKFNIGAANGSNDSVYRIPAAEGSDACDPTQYVVTPAVTGEGAFVTYITS